MSHGHYSFTGSVWKMSFKKLLAGCGTPNCRLHCHRGNQESPPVQWRRDGVHRGRLVWWACALRPVCRVWSGEGVSKAVVRGRRSRWRHAWCGDRRSAAPNARLKSRPKAGRSGAREYPKWRTLVVAVSELASATGFTGLSRWVVWGTATSNNRAS